MPKDIYNAYENTASSKTAKLTSMLLTFYSLALQYNGIYFLVGLKDISFHLPEPKFIIQLGRKTKHKLYFQPFHPMTC